MTSILKRVLIFFFFSKHTTVSEAPKEAPKVAKYSSKDILNAKTDDEKKSEVSIYLYHFNRFLFVKKSFYYKTLT